MKKRDSRILDAQKSSRIKIVSGVPNRVEGLDGDLALSDYKGEVKLYVKYKGGWHGISMGAAFDKIKNQIKSDKSSNVKRDKIQIATNNIKSDDSFTVDSSQGIYLDSGTGRFFFYYNGDTDDYMRITTGANGETSFRTYDSDGAEGHLSLTPDGKVKLTALDGVADSIQCNVSSNTFASFQVEDGSYSQLRLYENGGESSNDYLQIKCEEHGATTISTLDAAAAAAQKQ